MAKAKQNTQNGGEASATPKTQSVTISAPKIRTAEFRITGTAPFVQLRFSQKTMETMKAKMQAGSQAKSKKVREARNFDADFEAAKHIGANSGRCGIPCGGLRAALISACRLVGFKMTLAKLSLFVEADDIDVVDAVPLFFIEGTPEPNLMAVRNATGVIDLRCRPMWKEWSATVRIRFDEDQFSLQDVSNLLARVGLQVGLGEGRPDSRESAGLGWGTFTIAGSTK